MKLIDRLEPGTAIDLRGTGVWRWAMRQGDVCAGILTFQDGFPQHIRCVGRPAFGIYMGTSSLDWLFPVFYTAFGLVRWTTLDEPARWMHLKVLT